jgi:hypothetical protein
MKLFSSADKDPAARSVAEPALVFTLVEVFVVVRVVVFETAFEEFEFVVSVPQPTSSNAAVNDAESTIV